jgi:hypothetical protein
MERKTKNLESPCFVSIDDAGNMDLTEYRAVEDLYRRPVYMESQANTAPSTANAILFNQSNV